MNYKNCTHYNEIVRVLSENGSLDYVNFELEETKGCECEVDENSVCELWVTLAFVNDMAPQLGIDHAEQTIANLDTRMEKIATKLVINVGNKFERVEETETISETNIDSQLFAALPEEKQKLLEQLAQIGDVIYIKSNLSQRELIVKAISEMDIDSLEILVENQLRNDIREAFIEKIKLEFKKFKENEDTHLIAYSGKCNAATCNNYRNTGYSFTGNVNNTFYDLIFEKKNGVCKDICKCYSFKIDDDIVNKVKLEAERKESKSYNFTEEDLDNLPF